MPVCSRLLRYAVLGSVIAGSCSLTTRAGEPPPTHVFHNANIYTLDPLRPRVQAVGVADGRIVAIGSDEELRRLAQPQTRYFDLHGRTVLPGLIDAHGHMAGLGSFGLGRMDLSQAKSFDEVVAAVAERVKATKPGEPIVGGRWDHENWPDRKLPTHDKLSAVSPKNPVWLTRVDGHAGLANSAAMESAGVTRESPAPAGGEVLKDAGGELTGVFVDNAMSMISGALDQKLAQTEDLLLKAQEMCLSVGLTGVHDAGVTPSDVAVYRRLADDGKLKLRVYTMISASYAVQYFKENEPGGGERVAVRACKLYVDGAMGSRGAWLLEPYSDRQADSEGNAYSGLAVARPEFIRLVAEDAARRGYQVCTHAIGDRANREVLNAYQLALQRRPREDHRFRIEHAQLLSPEDLPRFARLGVIPSMQPTHCTSDMRWLEARVGSRRAAGAYAWASLLRSGARIAAGSDFPVESHNPFLGIYAAITRQDLDGKPDGGWRPQERITREEALRAFTIDAAYAAFEEHEKGSIQLGKLADFIVIDRDIMTSEPRAIADTRVLQTVIGGETVYRAADAAGSKAGGP